MSIPTLSLARPRAQVVLAPFLALALVLFIISLAYRPSLDDWFVFHDYIHIKGITSTTAGDYAKRVLDPTDGGESLFATGKLYRPVYYLVLLADYKAFGMRPFGYHVVNLSLHLLNVVLLWLIVARLTRSRVAPAVAALIYGIHPAYIDAPAWISAITEILLATFSLTSIYLFIRSLEERGALSGVFYAASFASAILALGSREPGAALFLILPAYYFLAHRPQDWRRPAAWSRFVPFFGVLAVWALLRLSVTGDVASGEGASGVGKVGWHMFINMFKFNGWAVIPVFSQVGLWVPVVEGVAAIGLLRLSEHLLRKGTGVARFAVAWWYLALVPYSTQETGLLAGRYMYFGMAAIAFLCGLFVAWLADLAWLPSLPWLRRPTLEVLARAGVAAVVVVSAAILTVGMLHRQDTFSGYGQEARALLDQLREQYPQIAAGATLYVVDPPLSTTFADKPLFLKPAVQLYYPQLADVRNIGRADYDQIAPTLSPNDPVFFYQPS